MEVMLLFGAKGLLPFLDFGSDSDDSAAAPEGEDNQPPRPDDTHRDMLADLLRDYEDLERPTGTGTPGDDVILP